MADNSRQIKKMRRHEEKETAYINNETHLCNFTEAFLCTKAPFKFVISGCN